MKNLIIGIGNLILGDDAVGPLIVRELQKSLFQHRHNFDFKENYSVGLDFLDEIRNYKRVMIIDSLNDDNYNPGSCIELKPEELEYAVNRRFLTSHGLNLPVLWEFGEKIGLNLPHECIIFGVVTKENFSFNENLSDDIRSSFHSITDTIRKKASAWI